MDFPADNLDIANILLTIKNDEHSPHGYRLKLRFDGQTVLATGEEPVGEPTPRLLESLSEASHAVLNDEGKFTDLVQDLLGTFSPSRVGISNHNASQFFTAPQYWIGLLDHLERKVLVATPL